MAFHRTSLETLLARFILPERFAVLQLGRLRELLLREARLLDTLSHSCVIPLDNGWLEQRTGFGDPYCCAGTAACCRQPSNKAEAVGGKSESPPTEESGSGETLLGSSDCQRSYRVGNLTDTPEGGCLRQPGAVAIAAMRPVSCHGGASCRYLSSNVRFSVNGDYSQGVNDAATLLLRSWVPLTLEDADDDGQDEGGELAHGNEDISDGGSRNSSQYGGLEQLRWGGDDKTDWKGTAEPKSTGQFAATGECCCSCEFGGRVSTNDGGGEGFQPWRRERTLSLASYLLLPDSLPLSVWFETEFEPRAASSDEQGGAVTARAVTAAGDWALVWRYLLSMFVQVSPCSLKRVGVEIVCVSATL